MWMWEREGGRGVGAGGWGCELKHTICRLQTCCQRFLSSFFLRGLIRKSAAPFNMHFNTTLTESWEDITASSSEGMSSCFSRIWKQQVNPQKSCQNGILITGIFLQASCSVIKVRSAYPDIDGNSTSVNIRSMLFCPSFSVSQAFKPSGTASTAQANKEIAFSFRLTPQRRTRTGNKKRYKN